MKNSHSPPWASRLVMAVKLVCFKIYACRGGRFTPKSPPIPDRLRPYWAQSLVNPVCVKTYASGVLPLAGPQKLDWSRVTGNTGVSPW